MFILNHKSPKLLRDYLPCVVLPPYPWPHICRRGQLPYVILSTILVDRRGQLLYVILSAILDLLKLGEHISAVVTSGFLTLAKLWPRYWRNTRYRRCAAVLRTTECWCRPTWRREDLRRWGIASAEEIFWLVGVQSNRDIELHNKTNYFISAEITIAK